MAQELIRFFLFVLPTSESTSTHQWSIDVVYSMSARYGCSVALRFRVSRYQGLVIE